MSGAAERWISAGVWALAIAADVTMNLKAEPDVELIQGQLALNLVRYRSRTAKRDYDRD